MEKKGGPKGKDDRICCNFAALVSGGSESHAGLRTAAKRGSYFSLVAFFALLKSLNWMSLKITSIDLKPACNCQAMIPSSGILGKSPSTIVSPLTLMVTCLPTHLIWYSLKSFVLTAFLTRSPGDCFIMPPKRSPYRLRQ